MSKFATEKVLSVHHWNDTLFSIKTTRDPGLRFENGKFVMIGLEVNDKPLVRALESSRVDAVLYRDVNDPRGVGLLGMSEDPAFFAEPWREMLHAEPFATLAPRRELTMFGRTYSSGFEPDLEDWLLRRPRRTVMNASWPWAIWYPLRRSGAFARLSAKEQGEIIREHGIVGLSEDDIDHLSRAWHRLRPWPDAVQGIARLKTRHIVGPLSNGSVRLLTDMAKAGGIGWDVIFGSDIFRRFKPDPQTYLGAARLLGLEPHQLMLASAHNADLAHARRNGLMTAFFPRPTEYGAGQTRDLVPEQEWDVTAEDIGDLAGKLGC